MERFARVSLLLALMLPAGCSVEGPPLQAYAARAPMAAARNAGNSADRLLAAHNRERAAAGVPPLRWDAALASAAAAYGPTLASLRRLQHSSRESRPGQRENLWMGTAGAYSPEQMVGSWASEKSMFRPGIFPNVSITGDWLDVSHYTQMIWRTTTSAGCAVHRGGGMDYLICRYSPPGNVDGRQVP